MLGFEVSPTLRSVDGIVHGFFSRYGGVSCGHLGSLNCSLKVGDKSENVAENRRRVLSALGLESFALLVPNLVHGSDSVVVSGLESPSKASQLPADAMITSEEGVALGITYADCLPILISSYDGQWIAAIHAGWRGIRTEIIIKTINRMRSISGSDGFMAAIGPCISESGFVVTKDIADYFAEAWPNHVRGDGRQKFVDLTSIAVEQLTICGLKYIEKVGGFTDLNPETYYSHRRDGGQTGRHIAVIAKAFRNKRIFFLAKKVN